MINVVMIQIAPELSDDDHAAHANLLAALTVMTCLGRRAGVSFR
ncbi:hypothetical protein [Sphingobium sp. YBL2]|nr:hypothetical protein [Sphingobium sp. YBL2]